MSPILFFIIFFTCTGVGKIFLQINSAAVAFINILKAAWEGLKKNLCEVWFYTSFFMIFIAPGQEQTTTGGPSFHGNRNVLSLHSFVAHLKKIL